MKRRWLKGTLIGVGALVFSTLGIFASDTLRGIDSGLNNIAGLGGSSICSGNSVPVKVDGAVICVDQYEASPTSVCPHTEPTNAIHTDVNIKTKGCAPTSAKGARPWNYVSLPQAQQLCASVGKRLPTSNEWYAFALGTETNKCVINESSPLPTGQKNCESSTGVMDTVGNLWEWVDESVSDGTFENRKLPPEGYVSSVDSNGIALTSDITEDELYGKDYFWSKETGVYGMVRGGFYGSGEDAGLYTVNASLQTSLATLGIGFRCVEDVF